MDYAVLYRWKAGVTGDVREVARLLQTEVDTYPDGVEKVAEYWLGTDESCSARDFSGRRSRHAHAARAGRPR